MHRLARALYFGLAGYAIPSFWLGLVGLVVFYANLQWVGGPGRIDIFLDGLVPVHTGLLLVDWDEPAGPGTEVRVVDAVPDDVATPQFLTSLVDTVLGVTPVQHHVEVRKRRERRDIPVREEDTRLF